MKDPEGIEPIKMKSQSCGWTCYVFERGFVSVWDEDGKMLSAHLEKSDDGTQAGAVRFLKGDGWTVQP